MFLFKTSISGPKSVFEFRESNALVAWQLYVRLTTDVGTNFQLAVPGFCKDLVNYWSVTAGEAVISSTNLISIRKRSSSMKA